MQLVINILLIMHIGAGGLALLAGPAAMLTQKGGRAHRLVGKLFFWCMTLVIITALIIALYKYIPFLLMIAALSYYSIVSGYRALYHKGLRNKKVIKPIDWLALSVNALANLAFIIWGATLLSTQTGTAILAFAFGGIGLTLSINNLINFIKKPKDPMHWLYAHIGGFMGGYIATVTAFSVTALQVVPGIWGWLWPTLVFTPVISGFIAYYKIKFKKGAKPAEVLVLK